MLPYHRDQTPDTTCIMDAVRSTAPNGGKREANLAIDEIWSIILSKDPVIEEQFRDIRTREFAFNMLSKDDREQIDAIAKRYIVQNEANQIQIEPVGLKALHTLSLLQENHLQLFSDELKHDTRLNPSGKTEARPQIAQASERPPVPLCNGHSNCYFNTLLQCFMSVSESIHLMHRPCIKKKNESDAAFVKRLELKNLLKQFAKSYQSKNISKQHIAFMRTFFQQNHHPDLQAKDFGKPNDPALVSEVLLPLIGYDLKLNSISESKNATERRVTPIGNILIQLQENAHTLQELFDDFFSFSQTETAIHKRHLSDLPDLLVLHVARAMHGNKENKQALILAEDQTLDASSALAKEEKNTVPQIYQLKSFASCVNNGHWRAFVKRGKQWFIADDGRIQKTDLETVRNHQKNGYLMVFEKLYWINAITRR